MSWVDPTSQACATGDVITAGRFNVINGNLNDLDRRTTPYSFGLGASESTNSNVYGNLATVGPAQAANIGENGRALISFYSSFQGNTIGDLIIMSYAISGGATYGPLDFDALTHQIANVLYSVRHGLTHLADIGFAAGPVRACTFTLKYKVNGTGTGTWQDRRIIVTPLGS